MWVQALIWWSERLFLVSLSLWLFVSHSNSVWLTRASVFRSIALFAKFYAPRGNPTQQTRKRKHSDSIPTFPIRNWGKFDKGHFWLTRVQIKIQRGNTEAEHTENLWKTNTDRGKELPFIKQWRIVRRSLLHGHKNCFQYFGKGTTWEEKSSLNNRQIDAYMIARDKITMQQNTCGGKWWPLEPHEFWSELVTDQGGCKLGGEW